jgi:hypothetical protein
VCCCELEKCEILVKTSLEEVLDLYSVSLAWVLTSRSVHV